MSEVFPDFFERCQPLPFEDLFASLVLDARAGLRQKAAAAQIDLLHAKAHAGWERYLLRRLSSAGSKAALCQFQVFKTVRSVFLAATTAKHRPAESLYRKFVGLAPEERLRKLCEEFPALADYCEILVSNWIATVTEFLGRLETDHRNLDAWFAGGAFALPVVSLQAGLSDPHQGGRCVVRLTFEGGASLIYKPRSVAPEAHFSDLLEQLNKEAIPHVLKPTQCRVRNGYGWMEDVKPRPCSSLAEVEAFYWRAGALLALVYLARGVDMHRENLIAAGEFPVLVDLEALWHPQEHVGVADSPLATSILRTGFLPQGNPQVGALYEWNALCHRVETDFLATSWTSINEENMRLERAKHPFRERHHLPVFVGTQRLAKDFLADILSGLRWVGEQVFENREKRKEFQRWVWTLMRCPRRRILRSSLSYQIVLEQLTTPSALRKKGAVTDDLTRLGQGSAPVTDAEWRALRQLDIPWFAQAEIQETSQADWLPVRTMDELRAQESFIVDALAFPANGEVRSA